MSRLGAVDPPAYRPTRVDDRQLPLRALEEHDDGNRQEDDGDENRDVEGLDVPFCVVK